MTAARRTICRNLSVILCLAALAAAPARGQHTKTVPPQNENVSVPLTGTAQINDEISEMLGYWQLGDAEHMRQYYADDATFVSGVYEPPLHGWDSYAAAYQSQFSQLSSVRLDRRNTIIRIEGDIAWAAYQWNFSAKVSGEAATAQGQTTLIFEHHGDRWLILHNHTSEICPELPQSQPATQPHAPVTPSAAPKP